VITFTEYVNSIHYREKIVRTLEASCATLSPAAYELFARPLRQELARVDAELETYRSVLCQASLPAAPLAAAQFGKLVIDTIERHLSMVVKTNVNVFLNTPTRAVPYAASGLAPERVVVTSQPVSQDCDLMMASA